MISSYERMEQFIYDNGILLLTHALPNDMSEDYFLDTEYGIKAITLSPKLATTAQRTCVLAEEIEHYITTPVDLYCVPRYIREKYERTARYNAVKKLLPFERLIDARRRSLDFYELADYLNVTPEFLEYGLRTYKEHYGLSVSYRDYTIYFEPFRVEKAS